MKNEKCAAEPDFFFIVFHFVVDSPDLYMREKKNLNEILIIFHWPLEKGKLKID